MAIKFSHLKKTFTALWGTFRCTLRDYPHIATSPENPQIDDTFLVAFPKSGITWLTFLIASVNLQKSGMKRRPTYFAINDLVPDIHVSRHLPAALPFPGHRFIKSHAPHNPLYSKVIYLVRDPRDIMISYHAFASKLGWFDGSLSAMIRDPHFGIDAWVHHAQSWLTKTRPSVSFNVIKYEDILNDPDAVLKHIYTILGFDIEEDVIKTAIEQSSFEKMKEDEILCSRQNLILPKDFTFVRKGGTYFSEVLTEQDQTFITTRAGETMKIFGYV